MCKRKIFQVTKHQNRQFNALKSLSIPKESTAQWIETHVSVRTSIQSQGFSLHIVVTCDKWDVALSGEREKEKGSLYTWQYVVRNIMQSPRKDWRKKAGEMIQEGEP